MDPEDHRSELKKLTYHFISEFNSLSEEDLNFKPNHQEWSIGQIIDHIITLNTTYFPVFESVINGGEKKPFIAKLGFVTKFFGDIIYQSVQVTNKRKAKTISIWEPKTSSIEADIVSKFEEHQSELISWFERIDDERYLRQSISSPANKYIVYKLSKTLDIIVEHERRHLIQALKVKSLL